MEKIAVLSREPSRDPINGDLMDAICTLPLPAEPHLIIYRYSQDAWIQEIASLMAEIYECFVNLGYIDPECVKHPPHNGSHEHDSLKMEVNRKAVTSLELSTDVVSLLKQLPYIEDDHDVFSDNPCPTFLTCLLDYRQPNDLIRSRDPHNGYNRSEGKTFSKDPFMEPWHVVIDPLGNNGNQMIISTRSRRLTFFYLWASEVGDVKTQSEFDPESAPREEEHSDCLELHPSRPATEFLQDLLQSCKKSESFPGFLSQGLYQRHSNSSSELHQTRTILGEDYWLDDLDDAGFVTAFEALRVRQWSQAARDMANSGARAGHLNNSERWTHFAELDETREHHLDDAKKNPPKGMAEREELEQRHEACHPFLAKGGDRNVSR